jgi:ABC-type branched-subunit amino acid transport system substrate-binding protein
MRNSMTKGKGLWVLAVVLAATLLVTACAPGPAGPEGKVVQIGRLTPLTGGGAAAEQPGFQGEVDYIKYFNEERGVPGITMELAWMDVGLEQSQFISAYRILVERGITLLHSGAAGTTTFKSQIDKDQVPFTSQAPTGTQVYPPGYIYSFWSLESEACAVALKYFMDNWHEDRPPRLQFFVMDGTWGRAVPEEATEYAESIGFEVLPLEVAPYVVLDAVPQLLRIQERGADLVWLQMIIQGAGPVLRDAERLGIAGQLTFAGTQWLMGEPLIKSSPAAAEGFLSPMCIPWIEETEIPGMKTMIDTEMKYHGTVYQGPEYTGGWIYGYVHCEAMKRALEEVGYENLDRPAVKRALESSEGFDVDGMTKIQWGPEDRRGASNYAVYEVQGGKIVRISDYLETPILVP